MKRIAIVGSASPARAEELGLNDVEEAQQAGEQLGLALAEAGYDIVVYSTLPGMFEIDVVRGYCQCESAREKSIHVTYSTNIQKEYIPDFADAEEKAHLFRDVPNRDSNWETSFYQSIAEVDGIILLGGGSSTLIAGLVASGHRKPIVTIGKFGGAAAQVWGILSVQTHYGIPKSDWDAMLQRNWTDSTAKALVQILTSQFERLVDEDAKQKEALESSIQERLELALKQHRVQVDKQKVIRNYSSMVLVLVVLIAIASIIALSLGDSSTNALYAILIIIPIAGGIVGSGARVLWQDSQSNSEKDLPQMSQNLALGLIAGFISAFIFLAAQFSSLLALNLEAAQLALQLKILVLFTIIISFAGGFALETVFDRIRTISPENVMKPLQDESLGV